MTARLALFGCLGWTLACAGAGDPPWSVYATPSETWSHADAVDGRDVWYVPCEPRSSTCCWLVGDTITREFFSGDSDEFTVTDAHPDGDGLALDVRHGADAERWKVRRDGAAIVFTDGQGVEHRMYRRDTPLPNLEEGCGD